MSVLKLSGIQIQLKFLMTKVLCREIYNKTTVIYGLKSDV